MKKSTAPILLAGKTWANADLLYASGFRAPDPIVFLDGGRERFMVVSRLELGRARKTCPGVRVVTPEDLRLRGRARRRWSAWAVGVVRLAGARSVRVAGDFPVAAARALERCGVRVRVEEGALYPRRAVKTAAEQAALRAVQTATCGAMRSAFALLRRARADTRGVLRLGRAVLTAEAVRRHINAYLLARDCLGGEPIVACGAQAADPHCVGSGPLRAGQPIVLDIFPQHQASGYWGDLTRTVVKGRADAATRRLFRAVKRAQAAALAALRPGVRADRVHRAAARELERCGFRTDPRAEPPSGFIHSTGHGVGLEVHEAPSVSAGQGPLKLGHVVTIEPGLYYPGVGGVRVEDTVVLVPGGFDRLASCPVFLEIP